MLKNLRLRTGMLVSFIFTGLALSLSIGWLRYNRSYESIKETLLLTSTARSLGLETIAEGVETEEQLNFLMQIGGELIQGHYISRPLPADEFEFFISNEEKLLRKEA